MARILVADDEEGFREYVMHVLEAAGYSVAQAEDGRAALRMVEEERFDLVITDLSMPHLHGMDLVRRLRSEQAEVEVIVFTAHGSIGDAVEAMKLGAFDFVEKPLQDPDQMTMLVRRALERRRLLALEERASRGRADESEIALAYGDPAMEQVVRAIERVAPTDATVLLLGESGTGKEVAAQAIHRASKRAAGPFVVVNCAALPETLVEAELFGHERGAFTGATERRRGRIELAEGGTFFLDEIAELRPETQAKLLRVLQDGRFEHVGGRQSITADVRWIAATNRDLEAMMEAGQFREDLYHRISLFPVQLPPLRDRRADIVPLAETILRRLSARSSRRVTLHDSARQALANHPWRGNVRELANVLERALIMTEGGEIGAEDLLLAVSRKAAPGGATSFEDAERDVLRAALEQCGGNRRQAAKLLGIAERTLYHKMKRYDVR